MRTTRTTLTGATLAAVLAVALLSGCSGGDSESSTAVESTPPTPTVTSPAAPDQDGDGTPDSSDPDRDGDGVNDSEDYAPLDPAVSVAPDADGDGVDDEADAYPDDPTRSMDYYYPSGAPVLDGYPVLVDTASLDNRVASWIDTPQAVALAPGVYAAYNPAQPDTYAYLDGPSDGDCAVRDLYFPETGGACWSGVLPGPQEPALG